MAEPPKFDKSFLIPEEARKMAQQWVNAGGNPTQIPNVLSRLDNLTLTDKQRQVLLDSLPENRRGPVNYITNERERTYQRYLDKGMTPEEARARQESSKLDATRRKQYDRELVASNLSEEYHAKTPLVFDEKGAVMPRPPSGNYDPSTVFGKDPKAGILDRINSSLANLKEQNAAARAATEAAEASSKRADAIRKMGLKIVKNPGTPLSMGLAAASTLMGSDDTYAQEAPIDEIKAPKNPKTLALANAIRELEARTKGSPASMLVPSASADWLYKMAYDQKPNNKDRLNVLMDFLP